MKTPALHSARRTINDSGSLNTIIKVKLYSKDLITRAGLAYCLEQSPEIVEIESDSTVDPDVFLISVENADASTLGFLESLSPTRTSRFMIIVNKNWQVDVYSALERGVRAVLWRSSITAATVSRAIREVADGKGMLPSGLQGSLMQRVQRVHQEVLAPRGLTSSAFSAREIEVLRLLSEGFDLDEISQEMRYSERTIKNILYDAMKRHNFNNRTQAVAYVLRSGLI
ncbi:response regulator transcription factor [Streptomyces zhihengii]|uniref:Response regulator transcription factor n=1 Tax=Streptomyces zhihengii TaxID=1818004 RepID=A0ABS2V4G9_9ACTN|nr:response regulator transcription factor [Streptomyces zhihengii]MBM9624569.1 response regulator transcription factor [Streptomyces zhihengii]